MSQHVDVVVGRQGVYDMSGVIGYELLFRSVGVQGSRPVTGDQMTAAVLFAAVSIGLDTLVGDLLVFCNADRGLLTGTVPLMLPPERTVLGVLETVVVDGEVIAGCERLVAAGYRLALDGYVCGGGQDVLVPLASIVKIDLLMTPPDTLADVIKACRVHDVRMLAQRVEHTRDLLRLGDLGFELFQGYALERPVVVSGKILEPAATSRVCAAGDLLGADGDFDKIEALLRRDPALAHQIIQLASQGRLGESRRRVNTIRDALVLAGAGPVRNWLALLLARPPGPAADSRDAFAATMMRARACELLAARVDRAQAGMAFAAGMLSSLDGLLHVPLAEIAATLSISDDLRAAAFGGDSPIARIVQDATDYQLGTHTVPTDTDPDQAPTRSGLTRAHLDEAFASAFTWAMQSQQAINQPVAPQS